MNAGAVATLTTVQILACTVLIVGCGQQPEDSAPESVNKRLDAIRTQLAPGGAPPDTMASGFEPVPPDSVLASDKPDGNDCFFSTDAIIRRKTGKNCLPGGDEQLRAEITASSRKCVKNCNTKARLKEANRAAAKLCRKFCRRNAPDTCEVRYAPTQSCAQTECFDDFARCSQKWPNMNGCYLLQGRRVWNCKCGYLQL